jgi:hypothetical protein
VVRLKKQLFKIRLGDSAPEVVREVADQQFIDQVDGPEDIVDEQQNPTVVIVPADHERIEAKEGIDDAGCPVVHWLIG